MNSKLCINNSHKYISFILVFQTLLLLSCNKETLPKVYVDDISKITSSSAVVAASILNGTVIVAEQGLVWGGTNNPSFDDDSVLAHPQGFEIFTLTMNKLKPNTRYYLRAYAKIDDERIIYGKTHSFTTKNALETFIDKRDGQEYEQTEISSQTWMAENLNFSTSNGSGYYDNNAGNVVYGRLYNWETACSACPEGWHLPSDGEWKQLEQEIGMGAEEVEDTLFRGGGEAYLLMEIGQEHWVCYQPDVTNEFEFNALPAGSFITQNNGSYRFTGIKSEAYFWTATESSPTKAWVRKLYCLPRDGKIYRQGVWKGFGASVRCVKD